jgi:amino-acid N-acetyltransferase
MKPTDLRGILQYVPAFRDRIFVIALDGVIVTDENFANLLLDVAVLRSLNIKVILVHGAGAAITVEATRRGVIPSDVDGCGITDDDTLDIAVTAANRLSHEILKGLAGHDLRAVCSNCITAGPYGVIKGVDHLHTGKVERVDVDFLNRLLEDACVPVIPPLGMDGAGGNYRINSDAVAVAVARAMGAIKLIYATSYDGLIVDQGLARQTSFAELDEALREAGRVPEELRSKSRHAVEACAGGVPRVHVINGLVDEGLLAEVFSNEGIGTLIYGNEYQGIRRARRSDIRTLRRMTRAAVENDELLRRTRAVMEDRYSDYYIFEIDHNPVGCVALHEYPDENVGEMAYLYVSPSHENQGLGRKLMKFVIAQAKERGLRKLIALSTQAFAFIRNKGGFQIGREEDLPADRRVQYEASGRRSKILFVDLS